MKQRWTFRAYPNEEQTIQLAPDIWLRPLCLELGARRSVATGSYSIDRGWLC